ncbi:MAG TPA: STAS domain-containing protein [Streptosporangiaceae bacterium]|nr:STAS domain-containing protein [Streptosporangiaceae bacterium]
MADDVLRITRSVGLPGLILAGEIDESSYPVLVRSLAALGSAQDVHVDLGGVDYCDLAGLRAIICVAAPGDTPQAPAPAGPAPSGPAPGGGRLAGGRVVLHAVPGRLRRILQILGWDAIPGVGFDERSLPGGRDPVSIR